MEEKQITVSFSGRSFTLSTGKVARQANGSVMLRSGDTVILTTACASKTASPTADFFPLRVDYQEKFSSAGKTLGGFLKREGKQTERETLLSRLTDRPIRPLFPEGYFNEVQLLSYVLSFDPEHAPEPLAICAASAALVISDIPFIKPVGAVRVGMIKGEFIINPSYEEQDKSVLDLLIAGTEDAILMIEGYCDFLTEEQVMAAIEEGHNSIRAICKQLGDWQNIVGKKKTVPVLYHASHELINEVEASIATEFNAASDIADKMEREIALASIEARVHEKFLLMEACPHSHNQVKAATKAVFSKLLRAKILKTKKRCDGRSTEEVRQISIEMALLPRAHGSALFTRGETQAIAVCTLGGESMGQRYETLMGDGLRRFYLQYSFPPYSVGEVGRNGPPGRREIGHGKLAERAIQAVLPKENFPYTIRLESNITESNGSSSMASVCGGCLALMDAGVPISRPVAGIAMGLILEEDNFVILSDILGIEDALGDMDFKITGDAQGITAFQMDIKVEGITHNIMQAALDQAKRGRTHILSKMIEICAKPNQHLSKYAPRIEQIFLKPSKIGTVIGPGGKMIRAIIEASGAEIDINDDGVVNIAAIDLDSLAIAKRMINDLIAEVELGKIYKGTVVSIQAFGAFVSLVGGKDGLCHISELCHKRVNTVEEVVKVGDEIEVKVLEINDRGQVRLSRKVLLPREDASPASIA